MSVEKENVKVSPQEDNIIELKHVRIGFKSGTQMRVVIDDLNLNIKRGEILGLVGESGSGKTTIGRAIARIIPTISGSILYNGVQINGKIPYSLDRELKTKIQMIYQDPSASLNERANVDYIVSEGLRAFHMYKNEKERLQKVNDIIVRVGLRPEHLRRFPHEFSGGQRQRIGIARSIVMNPEMIIADEPISALDVSIRAQILNLISDFKREKNMTVLFIAHDLSVVKYISDRIAVIYQGQIVEIASSDHPHIEKNKQVRIYQNTTDPTKTKLFEVYKDHFVRCLPEEEHIYRSKAEEYYKKHQTK